MIKQSEKGLYIFVKVVPNSSKNQIIPESEFVKIKITAQPIEGKANKSLIEFLSKEFKIPKSNIKITKGESSKDKTVLICTNDAEKLSAIKSYLTKD